VVFELSAHQLENISTSPRISLLLNIFPEHLDYFGSVAAYANAKKNIFRYHRKGDWLIIHESVAAEVELPVSEIRIYGTGIQRVASSNRAEDIALLDAASGKIKQRSLLIGQHNEDNILAALLAVSYFGIGFEESVKYLNDFNTLPHRLEFLGKANGISFYNDSISTVPESTIAALKALPETDSLILGGFDRGIDYSGLVDFVSQSQVKNVVLLGQVGQKLYRLMKDSSAEDKQYLLAETLEEAFPLILQHTNAGSVCLLSPAAASYDQFHNFEHRGDTFRTLVSSLPGFTK
jgi:UDP-N-acetylmuramoylalanine--D-glutamate ligase